MALNTITSVGANQLSAENKTTYDKKLLMRAIPKLYHSKAGEKVKLPQNGGTIVDKRIYNRLSPSASLTSETISEGTTPASTNISVSNYTLTAKQYGAFCVITDKLQRHGIDNNIYEASGVFGDYAGETFDIATRNDLIGNATIQYQGGVAEVVNVDNTCKLTVNGIKKAVRTLRSANVDGFSNLGGKYICLIHPDSEYDVTNDPDWKEVNVQNLNGENVYGYHIGTVSGCEIWVSTNAYVNTNAATSATATTGVKSTGGTYPDVYSSLVIAPEAYGVLDVEGDSGLSPKTIVKFASESDGNTDDPLAQRNTVGFKGSIDSAVFKTDRMIEIRHSVSS